MRASLQVIASPARPRRIELREGQAVRIGRSDWADYAFREDPGLADIHFVVACLHTGCFLRHLAPGSATSVNDAEVQETRLRSGDRVRAGRTTFAVTIEGEAIVSPSAEAGGVSENTEVELAEKPADHWQALAEQLELDPAASELIGDPQTLDNWLEALAEKEQFLAAARLRAHHLDPRAAVWWGLLSVRLHGVEERLSALQKEALQASLAWVAAPAEPARYAAGGWAERLKYRGIGAKLAAATFWAGPSLAPPQMLPVPPDPLLVGVTITTTLLLAAIDQSPKLALQRWPTYLELGKAVAAGEHPWPSPPAAS